MDRPVLSVVIPAYNEAAAIRSTVEAVDHYLAGLRTTHEIIVVDDGSTDRTADIVTSLIPALPSVRLLSSRHQGKGGAVKQGMLAARGEQLLFMDADHSTRIEGWSQLVPWLRDGYDVVIGSRKMAGASIQVRQPPLREAMGKTFTWLSNVVLPIRVSDVTCGFKAFQAAAARRIFPLQRIEGWGFDAEMLFIARQMGCRIKEVPVVWRNDRSTNVRLLRDAIHSLTELVQIRGWAWQGRYRS